MKQLRIFLYIFIAITLVACGSKKGTATVQKKGVKFIENPSSMSSVMEKANRDNKAVFIDVYADWCVPCKIMDEEIFALKPTADYMNKNFINVKVDAEKGNGPNIAALYGVYVYPTLLFVDSKGRVLERMDGSLSNSELLAMGDRALSGQSGLND